MKIVKSNTNRIKLISFFILISAITIGILIFTFAQNNQQIDEFKSEEKIDNIEVEADETIDENLKHSDLQKDESKTERVKVSDHSHISPPEVLIEAVVNNLAYSMSFDNQKENGTKCTFTASNDVNSISTESVVVNRKCSGKITDSALSQGSEWTILLVHKSNDGTETVTKKAVQIN